ncbi:MAG: GntR family transcriptional regulator [Rhodospirillales bacterium]|nr:GntR family transcriptional regulator [Rhodospirillales bacterium]
MPARKQMELAGDSRLPLYQRLAEALKAEIVARVWRPGDRLPSESDIADRYAVALGTARQAVSQLAEEGLVDRRHGTGTFVRKPSFDLDLFRFFRFQTEEGERRIPESRILRREVLEAPSTVSQALGIAPKSRAISMSRLRLLDGVPVMGEEIWLEKARFEAFMDMEEAEIGPLLYPIYDAHFDQIVARAKECLTVEVADEAHARLLRLEGGAPVIVIERLALGYDGKPIEWRRSRGRADRFQYHIEIN